MPKNRAQITDVAYAVELYYSRIELSNADISRLFGVTSETAVLKLKRMAEEKAKELNKPRWNRYTVNTEAAYLAWGIDISNLERRVQKLAKLKAV